jgi:hypothetical protein
MEAREAGSRNCAIGHGGDGYINPTFDGTITGQKS